MFTTPCFIESSTKVRNWLVELGYEQFNMTNGRYMFTSRKSWLSDGKPWFSDFNFIQDEVSTPEYVDCRGNFELFKALTALRDDSDYMQWFVCGEDGDSSFLCMDDDVDKHIHNRMDGWDCSGCRKSSKEELINRFKK